MLSPTAEMERRETAPDPSKTVTPGRRKPRVVLWSAIVGTLLVLLLAGLYGFNQFRAHAIANFFANNKPPPASVAVVTAVSESVPRYASGIGSLAAVRQVTITPEVGGRITKIHFDAGAVVRTGDPLIQLNDDPEQGDLASLQAQVRFAEQSLQRSKALVRTQAVAQTTLDQNQSTLDQANAGIARTQAMIAQKLIRAPFGGRLGLRQVNLGQYVNIGATVVTLTDLSLLYVNFTLPSQLREQIKVGQSVRVVSDALPGRSFTAKVSTLEPQVSADTRTLQVQATMDNPGEALLPGMFVSAALVLPEQPDAVVLPETAIEYTLYGDSVYVVRQDGVDAKGAPVLKAMRTAVKTGARWNNKVEVLDGVKAGDVAVAAGQVKLQNGATVAISSEPPLVAPQTPTLN